MADSKKYKINKEDGVKILKGGVIAVAGALLAYVAELLPLVDFGQHDKIAMVIGMMIVNGGRKLLAGK